MSDAWFISDLHLGHKNSIGFTREDGSPLRPFADTDEMDEHLIQNINSKVRPRDRLYMLGDVTMPKSAIHKLARINGVKTLILGNHDHKVSLYDGIMHSVKPCQEFDGHILTHIPVHTSQIGRWKRNIHGHLHSGTVYVNSITKNLKRDIRYYNVSCDYYGWGGEGHPEYHSGMHFFPKAYEDIKKELYLD
jgi:calcineurin-like phosphoesterase family protein